jgi:hypothetical protein
MNSKINKAIEVYQFCQKLATDDPQRYSNCGPPLCGVDYAEAIVNWQEGDCNPESFFVPLDQDLFFLTFAKELSDHFGLKVVCYDDAELHQPAMIMAQQPTASQWDLN